MKLAAKVIFVFLLAVMVLTAIHGILAVRRERELFRQEHEDQARQFTGEIEDALRTAVQEGKHEKVADILKEKQTATRATQVHWVSFDTSASVRDGTTGEMRLQNIQRGEIVSFETHHGGTSTLHTFYALKTLPQGEGGLQFSTPLAPLEQRNRDTIFHTLYLLIAIGLLSVLVIVIAGIRMIGRPLEKLIDKTRRIGEGDLAAPLELHSHDELGQLAAALNEMCEKLNQQQQHIQYEAAAHLATMEQLRHADRLKTVGRLAAGIAHELGTPLNVVAGRAGLIASGKLNSEEVRTSAITIKSEAERITSVIRQLLDFARRHLPQRTNSDLRHTVQKTVDLLESMSAKQNVRLVIVGDEQPMPAMFDAGQFQQVLTNLVVNAIQAMLAGGQVTIQLGREKTMPPDGSSTSPIEVYSVTVEDQGDGIAKDDIAHIFEPFFTTKDVGQGTGLGLSIAYGIVQEHGGWIDVQSTKHVGSRFTIYLPVEASNPPTAKDSP